MMNKENDGAIPHNSEYEWMVTDLTEVSDISLSRCISEIDVTDIDILPASNQYMLLLHTKEIVPNDLNLNFIHNDNIDNGKVFPFRNRSKNSFDTTTSGATDHSFCTLSSTTSSLLRNDLSLLRNQVNINSSLLVDVNEVLNLQTNANYEEVDKSINNHNNNMVMKSFNTSVSVDNALNIVPSSSSPSSLMSLNLRSPLMTLSNRFLQAIQYQQQQQPQRQQQYDDDKLMSLYSLLCSSNPSTPHYSYPFYLTNHFVKHANQQSQHQHEQANTIITTTAATTTTTTTDTELHDNSKEIATFSSSRIVGESISASTITSQQHPVTSSAMMTTRTATVIHQLKRDPSEDNGARDSPFRIPPGESCSSNSSSSDNNYSDDNDDDDDDDPIMTTYYEYENINVNHVPFHYNNNINHHHNHNHQLQQQQQQQQHDVKEGPTCNDDNNDADPTPTATIRGVDDDSYDTTSTLGECICYTNHIVIAPTEEDIKLSISRATSVSHYIQLTLGILLIFRMVLYVDQSYNSNSNTQYINMNPLGCSNNNMATTAYNTTTMKMHLRTVLYKTNSNVDNIDNNTDNLNRSQHVSSPKLEHHHHHHRSLYREEVLSGFFKSHLYPNLDVLPPATLSVQQMLQSVDDGDDDVNE